MRKCNSEELKWIASIRKDICKPSNFSVLYGSGIRGLSNTIRAGGIEDSWAVAKKLLETTRGHKDEYGFYKDGMYSGFFNYAEQISEKMEIPTLPVLGTQITEALRPNNVQGDFKNCRLNFTVQASGAEMLSVIIMTVKWLSNYYSVPMHFIISLHDEVCFMIEDKYALEGAMILQLGHLYAWSLFFYQVGINDLPISRMFFSEVSIDQRFRKSPTESTITVSQHEEEENGNNYTFQELQSMGILDRLRLRRSSKC